MEKRYFSPLATPEMLVAQRQQEKDQFTAILSASEVAIANRRRHDETISFREIWNTSRARREREARVVAYERHDHLLPRD